MTSISRPTARNARRAIAPTTGVTRSVRREDEKRADERRLATHALWLAARGDGADIRLAATPARGALARRAAQGGAGRAYRAGEHSPGDRSEHLHRIGGLCASLPGEDARHRERQGPHG